MSGGRFDMLDDDGDHLAGLAAAGLPTVARRRLDERAASNVRRLPVADTSLEDASVAGSTLAKSYDIGIPYSRHLNSCPVRSVMTLRRKLMATTERDPVTGHRLPNQTNTGPLCRRIHRGGRFGGRLSRQGADGIINSYFAAAVDDPSAYSTHSLRAGLVTECSNHGVPEQTIRRTTRHTSSAGLNPYDRPHDLLNNGPRDCQMNGGTGLA